MRTLVGQTNSINEDFSYFLIAFATSTRVESYLMKKRKIGTETAYGKEGPRILDISSIRLPISIARQVRQIDFLRVEEKEEDVVFYHPMIQIHPKDAPYHIKSVWLSMYERVSFECGTYKYRYMYWLEFPIA